MENNANFASRLNRAMILRGVNGKELAEKLNMSSAAVTRYKQGQRRPKDTLVYAIAKALNVDPAWLIGFGENDDPTLMLSEEEILKRDIKRKLETLGETDLKKVLAFMENCL